MKTKSEVLERAAYLMERDGHWRGSILDCPYEERGDRRCVIIAIWAAARDERGRLHDADLPGLAMQIVARGAAPPPDHYVAAWSDSTPTAEVVAALRGLAMVERVREWPALPAAVAEEEAAA